MRRLTRFNWAISTPSSIVGEQKSSGSVAGAESVLALLAVFGVHLGGVLARFEHAFQIHEAAVALDEVAVGLGWNLARLQQPRPVDGPHLAIRRQPAQGIGIDLVAGNVAAADLLDNAVALQRQEEEADGLVDLIAAEGLPLRHMRRQRALQVATVSAVGRDEEPRTILLLAGPGIGDHGLREIPRILEIPDRLLQQTGIRLLDEIELLLRDRAHRP